MKLIAYFAIVINACGAANVLYVSPVPAISHYQMLEPLMIELARRGHNVTVISHYPRTKERTSDNYRDVDLTGLIEPYQLDFEAWGLIDDVLEMFRYGTENCRIITSSKLIQDFLKSDQNFDLVFLEAFDSDCYLGFVKRFRCPYVVYSAMALPVWTSDWIYNPTEVHYLPDHICRLSGKMNFLEKIQNFLCHMSFRLFYYYLSAKPSVEIVRNNFNVQIDTLEDVKRNASMIFVNSFHGLNGIRPLLPNVLELGGIHIKPPKPLPNKIEKFLNDSRDGAILFSMGSMIKGHTLDPKVKDGLLSVFGKLKEKVLWKWEAEFPEKPENVMTASWLPQTDVLGHPNVKVFVTHGGIHGLLEAIHHGVPVVGMPLYGDQESNLKRLQEAGAGAFLRFDPFDVDAFSSVLNDVLTNESYREKARFLSKIFRDRAKSPLETAVFWTEHLLRHSGANHFRTGALQLNWFQYLSMDVYLFCLFTFILFFSAFHLTLKYLGIIK